MLTIYGSGISSGVAMGNIAYFNRKSVSPTLEESADTALEIQRFTEAKEMAFAQLDQLYSKALSTVKKDDAIIFQIHQVLMSDRDFVDSITSMITSFKMNAEYAVHLTAENFAKMFARIDDPYMQGRAADIVDVSKRLIRILTGVTDSITIPNKPSILISDEFLPSETIEFANKNILGFVTSSGSTYSHSSILARHMQLPAVVGADGLLKGNYEGVFAIIDGFNGAVYLDPDEATIRKMKYRKKNSHSINRLCLLPEYQVG